MGSSSSKAKKNYLSNGSLQNSKKSEKQKTSVAPSAFPSKSTTSNNADKRSPLTIAGEDNRGVPVFLNVYNLRYAARKNGCLVCDCMGFGFYHSGIEVFGSEWSFAGAANCHPRICGIISCAPLTVLPPESLEVRLLLGHLPPDTQVSDIHKILRELAPEWAACRYHLFRRNCNHFSHAFRDAIAKEFKTVKIKKIPRYVNRAARVAAVVVPEALHRAFFENPSTPPPPPAVRTHRAARTVRSGKKDNAKRRPASTPTSTPTPSLAPVPIPSSEILEKMSLRELRTLMSLNGISFAGCIEKGDLILNIEEHRNMHACH